MVLQPLDVYPKFKKLLRPLSEDEFQRLEWSILKDGIMDSIKYWPNNGKNYIVDGHNRFEVFSKYPTEIGSYKADAMKFADEDEALEWIIENQLRRRNLNQNERVLYLGKLFEMRKKRRGRSSRTEDPGATADQIAIEQEVSPRTVTRAAEVVQAYDAADKELQRQFASGEISQAALLRAITKKDETKAEKKDKLRNDKTAAIAAVGERFARHIRSLRHLSEDLGAVCKAIKQDAGVLAPELANFADKLKIEETQAEALTTIVYVGNLCPNKGKSETCPDCKGATYLTAAEFEPLKPHFGIETKAQAA